MSDLAALAQEIEALKSFQQQQQQASQLDQFMGQFGANISNDRELGAQLLSQMSAMGIQAAQAGQEAAETLKFLADVKQGSLALADKIQIAIDQANESTGSAIDIPLPPVDAGMLPPVPGMDAGAPPPMDMPPADVPPGPPMDAALPPADIPPEGAAPIPPPEEVPPAAPPLITSDKRAKTIVHRPAQKTWKPASHIVNAMQGMRTRG